MLLVLCLTMWLTINTERAWLQNHINITSLVNQSECSKVMMSLIA